MKKNKILQSIKRMIKKVFVTKKRTIIFIVVLLVVLFGTYEFFDLLNDSNTTFLVENGRISQHETVEGFLLRSETVVVGENYGNELVQIRSEGEKVGKGEPIFRYTSQNEKELNEKIQELDIQIQEVLKNEIVFFSSDIKLLDNQIEEALIESYKINDLKKINGYKKDINSYMTKKAKIAGNYSKNGTIIKDLITKRNEYEKQLNNSSEYIKSATSGIVSYKIDGLENVLKIGDYNYLSTEFLKGLNIKTSQIISSNSEKGKLIDNFKCYIACTLNSEESKKAKVGDLLKLRLPNTSEITTKIEFIKDEENGDRLFVFEVENEINELISSRKIVVDVIWWSDTGLKVPVSAVNNEEKLTYVIRNKAGYEEKVYVKVLRQNNKYAIVKNYSNEELVNLGYDLNNLSGKKSISLYDEIKYRTNRK